MLLWVAFSVCVRVVSLVEVLKLEEKEKLLELGAFEVGRLNFKNFSLRDT